MRRDGRRAVYSVAGPHVRRLVVEALQAAEHRVLDWPPHRSVSPSAREDAGGTPPQPEAGPEHEGPRLPAPR